MSQKIDVLSVLDSLIEYHDTSDSLKGRNCIAARAAVAELIERLEVSNFRLANLLVLIPAGRPERAQIEQDMAENRAALARVGGAK